MKTFKPSEIAQGLHVKYNMAHDARGRFAHSAFGSEGGAATATRPAGPPKLMPPAPPALQELIDQSRKDSWWRENDWEEADKKYGFTDEEHAKYRDIYWDYNERRNQKDWNAHQWYREKFGNPTTQEEYEASNKIERRYDTWQTVYSKEVSPTRPTGDSISDYFQTSRKYLKEDGYTVNVGGKEVTIGGGVLYAPHRGGSCIDFDGRVTVGPRDWLGKKAADLPEVKKAVFDREAELVAAASRGGDFRNAKPSNDQDAIAGVLYAYKTPLATDYEPMNRLTKAYFEHTEVTPKLPLMVRNRAKEYDEQAERQAQQAEAAGHPELAAQFREWGKEYYKTEVQDTIRNIKTLEHSGNIYSQRTVDQYVSEVARTQADLRERFPDKDTITLYRGVQGDYAKAIKKELKKNPEVEIAVNPVSSWTEEEFVARKFAAKGKGVILKREVPKDEVLFTHYTSPYIRTRDFVMGGEEEYEFLVGNRSGSLRIGRADVVTES